MRQIKFALLVCLLSSSAFADPPGDALFGEINGFAVAAYAQDGPLGICIELDRINTQGTWINFRNLMCGITQTTLDAHGGAVGLIQYNLSDINAAIQTQFGGGSGVIGQINTGFRTGYKFVGTSMQPK